jgi:hypothetical protein
MRCALLTFALCLLVFVPRAHGQAGGSLQAVKRIFVDGFGDKPDLREVKADLIRELKKSKLFEVAASAQRADATLNGHGDTWLKGYYSLNPRSGTSIANGQPVYGGYVSVELKDRAGTTLWSYLATPHGSSRNIARDLSKDVFKHLVSSYSEPGRP